MPSEHEREPQDTELEGILRNNNLALETQINKRAVDKPSKKETTYINIWKVLGDGNWHNKTDFVRPFSADIRRLEEMQNPKGFITFEKQKFGKYYKYRITKILPSFWDYYKQFNNIKIEKSGQLNFAGV